MKYFEKKRVLFVIIKGIKPYSIVTKKKRESFLLSHCMKYMMVITCFHVVSEKKEEKRFLKDDRFLFFNQHCLTS